jgi:Ca2+:H+ antiporter
MSLPGNVRQVRAEAHKLSRHGAGWNPFGHTFRKGDDNRRETWNGSQTRDIEAQRVTPAEDEATSPLEHARTEPTNPFRRTSDADEYGGRRNAPGSSKEIEARDGERRGEEDSNTTYVSQQSTTGTAGTGLEPQNGMVRFRSSGRDTSAPAIGADSEETKKEPKQHRLFMHVQPKEPFTVANQIQRTILNSWINILILAAPAGIALGFVPGINGIITFVVNFIAIIPLAAMLSFATEEIALRTGETLGGLLNATFGYVCSRSSSHQTERLALTNWPQQKRSRADRGHHCFDQR